MYCIPLTLLSSSSSSLRSSSISSGNGNGGNKICAHHLRQQHLFHRSRRLTNDGRGTLRHVRKGKILTEDDDDDKNKGGDEKNKITLEDMLEQAADEIGLGSVDGFDDDDEEENMIIKRKGTKNTNTASTAKIKVEQSIAFARKVISKGQEAKRNTEKNLERAQEISKTAMANADIIKKKIEAVPNKKEISAAVASVAAVTTVISTIAAEPLLTMAGSVIAFSLVKSFETMDKELRERAEREKKENMIIKDNNNKISNQEKIATITTNTSSSTTTTTQVGQEEEKEEIPSSVIIVASKNMAEAAEAEVFKVVEEEVAVATTVAVPVMQQTVVAAEKEIELSVQENKWSTADPLITATTSSQNFVSEIADANEAAIINARRRREVILNEMALFNDSPESPKMRIGAMAETTNNKYFASRASKRTADVIGFSSVQPRNVVPDVVVVEQTPSSSTNSTKKKNEKEDDEKINGLGIIAALLSFPFTLLYELFQSCVRALKNFFSRATKFEKK